MSFRHARRLPRAELPKTGSRGTYPPCLASQACRRAALTCRAHPTSLVSQTCQRAKAARDRHAKATVDSVVLACSPAAVNETPQNGVTWRLPTCGASKAKRAGVPACLVGQTCRRAEAACHRHAKAAVDNVVPPCPLPAAHGTPQNGGAYPPCLASQTCRRATLTRRAHPACLVSQTCQRAKAARHRHGKATVDDVVSVCSLPAAHGTPQNGGAYKPCRASQTCRRARLTCRADPACLVSQTCQRAEAARHRHAKATVDSVVPACSPAAVHETPQNGVTLRLPTHRASQAKRAGVPCQPEVATELA